MQGFTDVKYGPLVVKYGQKNMVQKVTSRKNADQYENVGFRLLNNQLVKSILTLNYTKNRIEGPLMVKFLSCFLHQIYFFCFRE